MKVLLQKPHCNRGVTIAAYRWPCVRKHAGFRLTDTPHTSTDFENQLKEAHDRVLQLGARVERQVVDAMESLGSGSGALVDQIMQHELVINALEVEIDALWGRSSPAASPPPGTCGCQWRSSRRPLTSSSDELDIVFVAKSLERIGDHSKNIAEQVIYAVDGRDVRHASDPRR